MLKLLASGAVAAILTWSAATLAPATAAAPSASLLGEAKSAVSSDIVAVRDRSRYRGDRSYRRDRRYRRPPARWRRYDRRYRGPYYGPYYDDWYGPACIIVGPVVICP